MEDNHLEKIVTHDVQIDMLKKSLYDNEKVSKDISVKVNEIDKQMGVFQNNFRLWIDSAELRYKEFKKDITTNQRILNSLYIKIAGVSLAGSGGLVILMKIIDKLL